jgi:hypothetical protein
MENQNNHHKNSGNQNNRRPDNRGRPYNRSRNHSGQEKRTSTTRIGSGDRNRSQTNVQGAAVKGKEPQKSNDRPVSDNPNRERSEHRHSQQGRFPRNNNRSHYEPFNRSIRTKREETVEDIQSDVEQIEKDIQFEIKQIRSIKLGL